ncbi:hypothetical protein EIN_152600 [Entamoeba invadens IP1]|uniref:DH domain-containing protein n=1 Tax=Entamoeba invadens IP1 TaxID=370355 RepID=A0A0A1UC36_ENTIV|nr:hypothetical protein EIN_152600 [Entamoeba invadens IP1]ELP91273.1 hypothetical protein EIN_152600 [Entamoeba invadens IP1]|eukprot:XP_004258044.1 hypothetical protein EIN_152600 [Entamoeba invadens IP1]
MSFGVELTRTRPKPQSCCDCTFPLFCFPVCYQCKKVVYNCSHQTDIRRRTVALSVKLTRLMNDYQTLLECFDPTNPEGFQPLKDQFLEMVNTLVKQSFEPEDTSFERQKAVQRSQEIKSKILNEVFETEQAYNADLLLTLQYYIPLVQKELKSDGVEFETILEKILYLSNDFVYVLENKKETILEEIQTLIGRLDIYADYFALYHKNCKKLEEMRKMESFLKLKNNGLFLRKLDVMDFLVKPLQRLTKYPLLLKEAKKYLVAPNEITWVTKVETRLQEVIQTQNERQRKFVSNEMLKNIEPKLNWKKHQKIDFTQADLLSESDVSAYEISKKEKILDKLLTFHDRILFAKSGVLGKYDVSDIVLFTEIELNTKSTVQKEVELKIKRENPKKYNITFKSQNEKSVWITKFKEFTAKKDTFGLVKSTTRSEVQTLKKPKEKDVFSLLHNYSSSTMGKLTTSEEFVHVSRQSLL